MKMPDGQFTSMDNTRITAAREAGVNVEAVVRNFDEPPTRQMQEARGWENYGTWGDAISERIQSQSGGFGSTLSLWIPRSTQHQRKIEMKKFLFDLPILPEGFAFPASYRRLVENGSWPDIEPWRCLADDMPRIALVLRLYAREVQGGAACAIRNNLRSDRSLQRRLRHARTVRRQ
ncbi:hypothetical protein [Variovorax sp. YR752]|uniref:hypothetical protein n=1 Tax=Variovorax sp. YR752 TaxID=1884383 RepID=UPI001C53BAA0|nr:hypothetical protein [Variovorax sp. YR752]